MSKSTKSTTIRINKDTKHLLDNMLPHDATYDYGLRYLAKFYIEAVRGKKR